MFKKIIRIYFMICALLLGACQTNTSSTTLALLDKVIFTFEAKKPMVINHSNQNQSSSNHIMDGTFLKPEKPSDQNEETDHKIVEETTPKKPPIPDKNEATDDVIGFYDTTIEQEVIELVNDLRLQLGLKAVEQSESLTTTARLKSKDMAKYNYFSHEGHLTFASLVETYQISCQISGENIFKSQSPLLVASEIFEAWKQSPTHYANMTNEQFTKMGIGVYGIEQEGVRTYYVTQHLTD